MAVVLVVVVKVVVIVVATDAVESILLLFGVSGECVPWASIRPFQKGKRRGRRTQLKPEAAEGLNWPALKNEKHRVM